MAIGIRTNNEGNKQFPFIFALMIKEEKAMSKIDLKPISTGDIATMRKLREEGLTNKKIAERMGDQCFQRVQAYWSQESGCQVR